LGELYINDFKRNPKFDKFYSSPFFDIVSYLIDNVATIF